MNNKTMTQEETEVFIRSTQFAIVAINKENTKIFSFAFLDSELREEDFFDVRTKLTQAGNLPDFKLRMATQNELNQARNAYLQNVNGYKTEYFDLSNDKPKH